MTSINSTQFKPVPFVPFEETGYPSCYKAPDGTTYPGLLTRNSKGQLVRVWELTPEEVQNMDPKTFQTLAREVNQCRHAHFQKVYNTKGDGRPKGNSNIFNLHREVQDRFNPNLTDEENAEEISTALLLKWSSATSLRKKIKLGNVNRNDLYDLVLEAVKSFRPVHQNFKGHITFAEKLKYEILFNHQKKQEHSNDLK